MRKKLHAFACVLVLVSSTSQVFAQAAATQHTERVADTPPAADSQNWTASLGAVLNTGNTQAYSISGGTNFAITRGKNGFMFDSAGNFGRAVPAATMAMPNPDWTLNSRNIISRARYDYSILPQHAVFVSVGHRWDTFSGLDARVQVQAGYQYNIIREEKHRLWAEIGYDFTFDNIHGANDENITYHSVRLFAGWDHHVSEYVAFKTGLEGLFNVQDGSDVRLNWENTLNTHVNTRLAIEVKFNLYYDHQPVQGKEALDTRTMLNLVLDMW